MQKNIPDGHVMLRPLSSILLIAVTAITYSAICLWVEIWILLSALFRHDLQNQQKNRTYP